MVIKIKTFVISQYECIYVYTNGYYQQDVWTEYNDIGKVFNGNILTENEYFKTELKYLSFIEEIISLIGIDNLIIEGIENCSQDKVYKWKNNQLITKDNLSEIMKDLLRIRYWCRLNNDEFFIHVGNDLLVYIGCNLTLNDISKIAKKYNLYCMEVNASPYKRDYEDDEYTNFCEREV